MRDSLQSAGQLDDVIGQTELRGVQMSRRWISCADKRDKLYVHYDLASRCGMIMKKVASFGPRPPSQVSLSSCSRCRNGQ